MVPSTSLTKYWPLSLSFGLGEDDEDDTDPGLLWSVQRAVAAPPPWYHMPLYFTNWEREMVLLMITRSDQTVFSEPKFFSFFSSSFTAINLPMPIDSCYSDAMVCYLQSCECKEFLLFVLFVLWIAVGILKNIRTIKLEQLFSKYLILWTLHCGNSRALAVSERGSEWNLFNVQNLHQTFINLTQLAPPLVNKKFW